MFRKDDILITKRLTLRPTLEVDADDIAHFLDDYDILKMTSTPPYPFTKQDAQQVFIDTEARWAGGSGKIFAIIRERCIGSISIKLDQKAATLGYWLAKPYWGQGFMSESLQAVLSHSFNSLAIDEIHANVFKDNPTSLHLLQKFGFEISSEDEVFSRARNDTAAGFITKLKRNQFTKH